MIANSIKADWNGEGGVGGWDERLNVKGGSDMVSLRECQVAGWGGRRGRRGWRTHKQKKNPFKTKTQ